MNKILCFFLLSISTAAFGQAKYQIPTLPVTKNQQLLKNAWTGGMNNPVFSEVDLDGDGRLDLFVYDKGANKMLTFLNNGSQTDMPYEYAPQFEKYFPDTIHDWAVIRDYNKDGVGDIFTINENQGIRCYKGKRTGSVWSFTLASNELRYSDGTIHDRVWTFYDNLPGFVDVNNDGDLDVMSFSIFGGTNIEYYENQSKELGYGNDSLIFAAADLCWGRFIRSNNYNSLVLAYCKNDGSGIKAAPNPDSRHQGGAMFTFDYEGDGDVDVLLSDISYNTMLFAQNDGSDTLAQVLQFDSIFPKYDTPINMAVCPGAYAVDVNNDGYKDLLVSPFFAGPQQGLSRDVKNVMLYKNKQLPPLTKYAYQSDTFLVNTHMDFGSDSRPVFLDYNNDGLEDIVVGDYGYYVPLTTSISKLALLQNTGTPDNPQFTEIEDDWNKLTKYNLLGISPTFGDIDGDGKKDMIIGESTGKIHFFKNSGNVASPYLAMTTPNYFGIDIGQNSAPILYDVNDDNLLDLVIGRYDGKLSYYWNFGTATAPLFHPDSTNSFFGNIKVTDAYGSSYTGYSCPFIKQEGSKKYLYTGSQRGFIFKFEIKSDSLRSGTFALIDTNIFHFRVGQKSNVVMADLNGDGKQEYIFGNARGGLTLYTDSIWKSVSAIKDVQEKDIEMRLFPNPAHNQLRCEIIGDAIHISKAEVLNMIGEKIIIPYQITSDHQVLLDVSNVANGIYLLQIQIGVATVNKKFVVMR